MCYKMRDDVIKRYVFDEKEKRWLDFDDEDEWEEACRWQSIFFDIMSVKDEDIKVNELKWCFLICSIKLRLNESFSRM